MTYVKVIVAYYYKFLISAHGAVCIRSNYSNEKKVQGTHENSKLYFEIYLFNKITEPEVEFCKYSCVVYVGVCISLSYVNEFLVIYFHNVFLSCLK